MRAFSHRFQGNPSPRILMESPTRVIVMNQIKKIKIANPNAIMDRFTPIVRLIINYMNELQFFHRFHPLWDTKRGNTRQCLKARQMEERRSLR